MKVNWKQIGIIAIVITAVAFLCLQWLLHDLQDTFDAVRVELEKSQAPTEPKAP
jgi:hypothetical protein